ncbi:hypothetical protein DICPUDRAFT_90943 [Dictyostelium purpureum]|uniref:Zeta-coat protein n=1 Tax=Dictyostelium purpureum TaxID=5786 RepID=F1A5V8_DICPU|nr:uncharacterized protein DICPUDRAFT_90943 [Dictyostelium purpureum]EGC28426.1 hypothetical protein DICPUDRAFT_90943 [Dictyostelium purpureum]|eukprot:XP_003295053.1 hypothetical protein DICPUDRAFT_90943 [Dictyostelium purpureum]
MSSFLYTVSSFFILDNKGERVISKYYNNDFDNLQKQRAFEKKVFDKTSKVNFGGEITLLDNYLIVYKAFSNIIIYMIGDSDQNEIALLYVLNSFVDTLQNLFENSQINKKLILDGINYTLLTLDEIIDGGVIMESDSTVVADRVGIKLPENDDLEESINKTVTSVKEQFFSFLR